MTKEQVKKVLDEKLQAKKLSCWKRGVILYAYELLEVFNENEEIGKNNDLNFCLLDGAFNWYDFSYKGKALINKISICDRLATPSERKRTKNGLLKPNKKENWLDFQARALTQASALIYLIVNQ